MKGSLAKFWFVARIVIIGLNIGGIASYRGEQSSFSGKDCLGMLLVGVSSLCLGFLLVFAALTLRRRDKKVDWSKTYSWDKPFLPMRKYPSRFWLLAAISAIAGGAVGAAIEIASQRDPLLGLFSLFVGLGIAAALRTWMKVLGPKPSSSLS